MFKQIRNSWAEILIATFCLSLVGVAGVGVVDVHAQSNPNLNPPLAVPSEQDYVSLKAENEALRNLIMQLQEQVGSLRKELAQTAAKVLPTVTPEKPVADTSWMSPGVYASIYAKAKSDARAACKEAGGKLWVMIQSHGTVQQTVAISCEFK